MASIGNLNPEDLLTDDECDRSESKFAPVLQLKNLANTSPLSLDSNAKSSIDKYNSEDLLTDDDCDRSAPKPVADAKPPSFQGFAEDLLVDDESDVESRRDHQSLLNILTKSSTKYQPKWKSARSESKPVVDEFNLSKDSKSKIGLAQLLKLSGNTTAKRSLRGFEEKLVLPKPLKKQISEKIARKVNFKEASRKVAKYDPVVKELRAADQLVFPVDQEKVPFKVDIQVNPSATKKALSAIEKEIMEQIAAVDDNVETNETFLTERELEILKAVNLETARKLHKELQRQRILTSFQEANYRRIRKIKSKKYHRLMKKDKLKKTLDEFEKLAAEDPEKASEKLDELNRLRALERASLKHRNTGKWAKHNKLRSKYDDKAREELGQQLEINTELMKKRSLALLPDTDDDAEISDGESSVNDSSENLNQVNSIAKRTCTKDGLGEIIEVPHNYNPWMSRQPRKRVKVTIDSTNKAITEAIPDNSKQFFAERVQKRIRDANKNEIEDIIHQDELDEILQEDVVSQFDSTDGKLISANQDESSDDEKDAKQISCDLVLKNQITSLGDIKKSIRMIGDGSDDEMDTDDINLNTNASQKYLREVFADTDVIDEFMKEKEQKEKPLPKYKTTYLPGWGSWAGTGIKENRKKKVRLMKRFERKEKRLDQKICNAIVLDSYREPVTKHMVSYRPAEINNVDAFEQKCLKPLGFTWNPETISQSLKQPKVVLRAGAIIKPMESKIAEDDDEAHF